jgi:hypothetical protein
MLQQTVVVVLLQTVQGAVMVVAVLVRPLPQQEQQQLTEQEQQQLLEQEQHPLLEQVPELATDGQEKASEAPHRVIAMLKTALLLVVTTLRVPLEHVVRVEMEHVVHAPLEHVVRVELEHVVRVEPGHARLAVTLTLS